MPSGALSPTLSRAERATARSCVDAARAKTLQSIGDALA
jgi:hypothetical protein